MYTKWLPKRSQNYPIHPLGAAKRPPNGILLSLVFFRQSFYTNCIYFVYISYVFLYTLLNLLILPLAWANPGFSPFRFDIVEQLSDFKLSPGCFGTDIIQKCTKWSQIGVHRLKIWQIFAKFQCVSFSIRKNVEKW